MPAVGKSGAGMISISSSIVRSRVAQQRAGSASTTSFRLCGGMLVAMPTAMPDEPLTSRFGSRVGRTSGSFSLAVVVRAEVDRFLVDVGEHLVRDLGQADLGVAHRRGVVAVDRAEVALAVDQHVAQREVLRHAHDRVVDRLVAVRVVLADHVADDARATSCTAGSSRCSARASRTARGGAPASGRRAHRAGRGRRSRSSRNRGSERRISSSRLMGRVSLANWVMRRRAACREARAKSRARVDDSKWRGAVAATQQRAAERSSYDGQNQVRRESPMAQ